MPRPTLARWMTWTAILAVNGGLLRAFLVQEMFTGGILIFLALQIAAWLAFRTTGRPRRFWLGFIAGGIGMTVAMFACEIDPDSAASRLLQAYTKAAFDILFDYVPAAVMDRLEERWELLLTVVYFLPELAAGLFGGAIAACSCRPASKCSRAPGR